MGMEVEDDLFFADLSKQISLLIMDDDDDQNPVATYSSVPFQVQIFLPFLTFSFSFDRILTQVHEFKIHEIN